MLQRLIGIGRVVEGRKTVAKEVRYELNFEQSVMIEFKSLSAKGSLMGLKNFEGVIDLVQGNKDELAPDRELTLVLEDGIKLDFTVTKHDPRYDIYYIKPVSKKEFYR